VRSQDFQGQILLLNYRWLANDHRPFDDVGQFADVSGPVVACEFGQGFIRYPAYASLGFSGKAMDEVLISSQENRSAIRV
jgi:hypothetical protein